MRHWLDQIQQMNVLTLSCVESINQGKKEIYQVPWSKVNTYSEYIPPPYAKVKYVP